MDVKVSEMSNNLRASWSKTAKRISLSEDSPDPIDALGIDTSKKMDDEVKKEAVPARNNWSVGLVDSDSEPESIVPDSEDEQEEECSDEQSDNEFIDDQAEEVESYSSGDSMDEDERREIDGNEKLFLNFIF